MVQLLGLVMAGAGVLMIAFGIAVAYIGYGWREEADRITEMETTDARDVRPGTVKVKGTARPTSEGETVPAPTADGEALATDVTVIKNPKGERRPGAAYTTETAFERRAAVPFVVEDDTGAVRVEPPDGEFGRFDFEGGVEYVHEDKDEDPSPEMQAYLDRVPTDREFTAEEGETVRYWRYDGYAVEPGDDVYVVGEARNAGFAGDQEYVVDGGENPEAFALSNQSESAVASSGLLGTVVLVAVGGAIALFGTLLTLVSVVIAL